MAGKPTREELEQKIELLEKEIVLHKRYRNLFADNNSIMMLIDADTGELVDVNAAACDFYGYGRKEMLKLTIYEINMLPEDALAGEMQLVRSGKYGHFLSDARLADGTVKNVEIYRGAIDVDERNLFYSIVHDITDRIKAEKALSESEEKYLSMMAAMKDLVHVCSADRRIEYMNPAMIQRTGYDATGEPCHRVLHGKDHICPWCACEVVQQGKCHSCTIISPMDNRHYHVSSVPLHRSDGSISKMALYRDITEVRMMEKEKKLLESRLTHVQKMDSLGILAGGIAHDFNNILMPIMGYTEMAMGDLSGNDETRGYLEEVFNAAERAKELVQQILTFSRQVEFEKKPLKVQLIVKETLKLIKASFPSTIEIRQNINGNCGSILADATQIHQVVMNLFTNAYHAMEESGGRLTVNLSEIYLDSDDQKLHPDLKPGHHLLLSIGDTGHGMDREVMEQIFTPYFTTKEQNRGTGLGLSIIHGIVKSCGGDITVYSEKGKGTTLNVYFPRIETNGEVKLENRPERRIPEGNGRILLVDDEVQIVEMEKEMMGHLGYQVTGETRSRAALELFRSSPDSFDLVITDMTMPDMTGVELSGKLLEIRPDIPIILCTGFNHLLTREKARDMGIRATLMKPLTITELMDAVQKVLGTA